MLQGNWLSQLCDRLEKEHGVKISDYARQFILNTAVAAIYDPNPQWGERKLSNDEVTDIITEELTKLVQSDSVKRSGVVTYFQALHWINTASAFRAFPVNKK